MKTLFRGTKTICHGRFQAKHLLWRSLTPNMGEDHYIFINNSLLHPATIGSVIVYSIFVNFWHIKGIMDTWKFQIPSLQKKWKKRRRSKWTWPIGLWIYQLLWYWNLMEIWKVDLSYPKLIDLIEWTPYSVVDWMFRWIDFYDLFSLDRKRYRSWSKSIPIRITDNLFSLSV